MIGAGNSGIFTNIAARPATGPGQQSGDGPEYAPEHEQKDGPPVSYPVKLSVTRADPPSRIKPLYVTLYHLIGTRPSFYLPQPRHLALSLHP